MKKPLLRKGIILALGMAASLSATQLAFAAQTTVYSGNGFDIKTEESVGNDGFTYTNVFTSYYGKSAELLAETEGINVAVRTQYNGEWNAWTPLKFYTSETSDRTYSVLNSFRNEGLQFCVTEQPLPTKKISFDKELSESGNHIAISDPVILDVPTENMEYQAPPYVVTVSPVVTSTFNLATNNASAHIRVIYNQPLRKLDSGEVSVSMQENDVDLNYKISNLTWGNIWYNNSNASQVEFDVDFDYSYNGQFARYTFVLNNLVGESSGKQPNEFGYTTTFYDCSEVYGCDDNNGSASSIIHMSQSKELGEGSLEADDAINLEHYGLDGFDTNILLEASNGSTTKIYVLRYNYTNSVAKINSGYQATLAVPYPSGFDKNSTFRAYKFIKDSDGNYVGQKLDTRIVAKGLEVSHGTFGGALKSADEIRAVAAASLEEEIAAREQTNAAAAAKAAAEKEAAEKAATEAAEKLAAEQEAAEKEAAEKAAAEAAEKEAAEKEAAEKAAAEAAEKEAAEKAAAEAAEKEAAEKAASEQEAIESEDDENDEDEELVILYADSNYKGASISIGVGSYLIRDLSPISNDSLSSLRVPEGYTVTLYEHGAYGGKAVVCTEDVKFLGDAPYKFNDKMSSLKVTKD